MKTKFCLNIDQTNHELPESFFYSLTQAFCQIMKIDDSFEISLSIVDETKISELNEKYRHQCGPTDVLTFVFAETSSFPRIADDYPVLGDIYICYEQVTKNSQKFGKTCQDELAMVYVHALLHLFGHHHPTDSDLKHINKFTQTIITKYKKNESKDQTTE